MLTIEQVAELMENGFTANQIGKINATLTAKGQEKKPEPEVKPEVKPEPEVKPKPEAKPEEKTENDLEAKIDEMQATIKEIQAANVKAAAHADEKTPTADDIIKSFMEAS